MSHNTWLELIANSQVDGTALTASTSATSLLPAAAKRTLPTNFFENVGQMALLLASGRISTVVTTPGTLTLDFRLGATAVASSGALALNIVAKTNVSWFYAMLLTVRAIGATANFMPQGFWFSEANINTAVPATGPGPGGALLPFNTAPVVGSNFDSTASLVADFFGTWSINNANSIQVHQYGFFLLN